MSKRRFLYSLLIILLLVVAVAGWFATDYLDNTARQEIIGESRASALTLSVYVSSTLNKFEEAVKSLAGSPWIAPALLSKEERDIEQANSALDRYNSALNASVSYLMDADGTTVASSNRNDPDSFVGKSYRFRPYFQEAFRGNPYRYFALGITSGKRGFYASYPVQNHLGKVVGVVTMKKDIDELKTLFSKYPFCFLISRDGIIFLSSTPAMVLKSLWPLDKTTHEKLIASQQFGNKHFEAVIEKEIADGAEVTLEGNDYFVSRKVIDNDGWSIVLLTPTDRIRIYKLIGILATIFVCFLIVVFSGVIYAIDRSKEAIRQSEELYKTLAEKSMAGVYVVQNGNFRFINSNAASYAGYTREELLDQKADLIVDPEDREKVRQNAKAMLRGEMSSPYEYRIITKQGETRWIMETVTSILHEGRPAILGNSMDITDHKKMQEEILTLSLTDPLTGLYNRRGFLALAEQQLKIATRTKIGLLLLFADLDGMKWINDNLGHKKGDEALMEAANVLKKVFRDADIIARVGGDEFSVLAVGVKIEDSRIVEDRLQYQIGINNGRENRDYSFSMSVGMAYNDPENPSTIDELMSHADVLMYEQKKGKLS